MAELITAVSTISFVVGYVIGFGVGWFATDKHWKAKLYIEKRKYTK